VKANKLFQIAVVLALLGLPLSLSAQGGLLKALQPGSSPSAPAAAQDALGRNTPRGSIVGFIEAAQRGDIDRALNYLELPRQSRDIDGDRLVRDLLVLFDRAFVGRVSDVSNVSEPSYNASLPPNQERAGEFVAGNKQADLILVRVPDQVSGHVWVISWTTLSKVNELADNVATNEFERRLPHALVRYEVLSIPLWVWLWIGILIVPAALVGALLSGFFWTPFWIARRFANHDATATWQAIRMPLLLFFSTFAHAYGVGLSHVPLLVRVFYGAVVRVVLISAIAWFFWSLISLWTRTEQLVVADRAERSRLTLVALGRRLLKAAIAITALFSILAVAGVNLTTVLAGLGIGGIAVALAAQKSLENLFGGVAVLSDKVIRVGDYCRFGDKEGIIEDIGLRSTRIRTPERIEVSIPNGAVSTMSISNLSLRDKMLMNPKINLGYDTTAKQLQDVVEDIRQLLQDHEDVESSTARVNFIAFAQASLAVELFAYVLTDDYNKFLATQEELLMRVWEIVAKHKVQFAPAAPVVYLERDKPTDPPSTTPPQK
jgi:MscS family membrane protein